jgi:hypothetical protein
MAKGKTKTSCLGAVLFFGFISFLANIGGCGNDGSKPSRTTSNDVDSLRLEKDESSKSKGDAGPDPLPQAIPITTPVVAQPFAKAPLSGPQTPPGATPGRSDTTPTNTPSGTVKGDAAIAKSVLFPTPSRKWTSDDGRTFLGIVTAFVNAARKPVR